MIRRRAVSIAQNDNAVSLLNDACKALHCLECVNLGKHLDVLGFGAERQFNFLDVSARLAGRHYNKVEVVLGCDFLNVNLVFNLEHGQLLNSSARNFDTFFSPHSASF